MNSPESGAPGESYYLHLRGTPVYKSMENIARHLGGYHAGLIDLRDIAGHIMRLTAERDRLQYQSTHDEMTDLLNRRGFMQAAHRRKKTLKPEESLAVIFGDLNKLKSVNDNFGHDEGDRYITQAAATLKEVFPEEDTLMGRAFNRGDEFLIFYGFDTGLVSAETMQEIISRKKEEATTRLAIALQQNEDWATLWAEDTSLGIKFGPTPIYSSAEAQSLSIDDMVKAAGLKLRDSRSQARTTS